MVRSIEEFESTTTARESSRCVLRASDVAIAPMRFLSFKRRQARSQARTSAWQDNSTVLERCSCGAWAGASAVHIVAAAASRSAGTDQRARQPPSPSVLAGPCTTSGGPAGDAGQAKSQGSQDLPV